ncbi:MAG: hypothetical protein QXQ60_07865 [Thermofilum sp.]
MSGDSGEDSSSAGAIERAGSGLAGTLSIALPLTLAICLRVYPFLLSGLPFSVDAWPSVRYAEVLLTRPLTGLNVEVLGTREELGDKLFGAFVSALTGWEPVRAMALFVPVAGSTSILVFYVLVRRICGGRVAFLASTLLAAAFADVMLTAGVKGETYAHPLYMMLILLFLQRGEDLRRILLFSLASASLVVAHCYTAILTSAILAFMCAAALASKWRTGGEVEARCLVFPLIPVLQALAYLALYASWVSAFFSEINWFSAASYQLVFLAVALHLAFTPHKPGLAGVLAACAAFAALALAFLATRKPLVPGAPVLPERYLLYAAPLVAAAPLSVLGYDMLKGAGNRYADIPLLWLAAVLGLEAYAVFGAEPGLGSTLAYRGLVFLMPPLSILCAAGLRRLSRNGLGLRKLGALALLVVILACNFLTFHAAIHVRERYLGYFWLNRRSEYGAGAWLSSGCGSSTVASDVKMAYLLRYYFWLRVDELRGLLYLSGRSREPEILLVYDWMVEKGYVVGGGYSVDLPGGWRGRVRALSLIYSNGAVEVYRGREV